MAAGFVSAPGTEFGPCVLGCAHKDCADSRRIAQSKCEICKKPIGYDKRYYQSENWTVFGHAVCANKEAEKRISTES